MKRPWVRNGSLALAVTGVVAAVALSQSQIQGAADGGAQTSRISDTPTAATATNVNFPADDTAGGAVIQAERPGSGVLQESGNVSTAGSGQKLFSTNSGEASVDDAAAFRQTPVSPLAGPAENDTANAGSASSAPTSRSTEAEQPAGGGADSTAPADNASVPAPSTDRAESSEVADGSTSATPTDEATSTPAPTGGSTSTMSLDGATGAPASTGDSTPAAPTGDSTPASLPTDDPTSTFLPTDGSTGPASLPETMPTTSPDNIPDSPEGEQPGPSITVPTPDSTSSLSALLE